MHIMVNFKTWSADHQDTVFLVRKSWVQFTGDPKFSSNSDDKNE